MTTNVCHHIWLFKLKKKKVNLIFNGIYVGGGTVHVCAGALRGQRQRWLCAALESLVLGTVRH